MRMLASAVIPATAQIILLRWWIGPSARVSKVPITFFITSIISSWSLRFFDDGTYWLDVLLTRSRCTASQRWYLAPTAYSSPSFQRQGRFHLSLRFPEQFRHEKWLLEHIRLDKVDLRGRRLLSTEEYQSVWPYHRWFGRICRGTYSGIVASGHFEGTLLILDLLKWRKGWWLRGRWTLFGGTRGGVEVVVPRLGNVSQLWSASAR